VLVDVSGGGEKEVKRGREWFDAAGVERKRVKGAEAKAWKKAVGEWAQGDEKWEALAKRMVGAILMAGRHHQRWSLVFGEAGTGKSVFVWVVERLVGKQGYLSTDAQQLSGSFGLDGVQSVRMVCVKEMTRLDGRDGENVGGVMKRLMGGDEITVNVKFERQTSNVKTRAWVVVTSNPIPKLPNTASGLSQKMLILPFTKVFRGEEGEDLGLGARLEGELEGIAEWALEGAREVEREGAKTRWPVPEEAAEVMRGFVLENNPADAFLTARCTRGKEGFVPNEMLWEAWEEWRRVNRVKFEVSRNRLGRYLIEEGTWGLKKHRQANGVLEGGGTAWVEADMPVDVLPSKFVVDDEGAGASHFQSPFGMRRKRVGRRDSVRSARTNFWPIFGAAASGGSASRYRGR
jgi:P4 family phage/plasmid primase-like protien